MRKRRFAAALLILLTVFMILPIKAYAADAADARRYTQAGTMKYDALSDFYGGVAAARLSGKMGLVTQAGKEVAPFDGYQSLSFLGFSPSGDPYFAAGKDGKFGVMDSEGKLTVPCLYASVKQMAGSVAIVSNSAGSLGLVRLRGGRTLTDMAYSEILASDDGALFTLIRQNECMAAGEDGKTIVPAGMFDDIGAFANGIARVRKGGLYGLAGADGRLAALAEFQWISENGGTSRHIAMKNGKYGVINSSGGAVVPFVHDGGEQVENGVFAMTGAGTVTVFDANGRTLVAPGEYAGAVGALGDLLIMRNHENLYGAVRLSDGAEAIPFRYTGVRDIRYGLCQLADSQNRITVFNEKGREVLPPMEYGMVLFREDGTIQATFSSNRWGLFDRDGKVILPYAYQSIGLMSGEYVTVSNEQGFAVFDRDGKEAVPFGAYDWISHTASGHALAVAKGGKYGWIKLDEYVVPPDDWAAAEVAEAVAKGLVPKALQRDYQARITRAEFCSLAVALIEARTQTDIGTYTKQYEAFRAVTLPVVAFNDTEDPMVLAAARFGIVNGRGNGIFDPLGSITREEAAAMLYRTCMTLGMVQPLGTPIAFEDARDFSPYAAEAVGYISSVIDAISGRRVMEGTGNGKFSPRGTYTRQQAFLTVLRLFNA